MAALLWLIVALQVPAAAAASGAGLAARGSAKYPPDFNAFAYASGSAVKGGRLVLGEQGTIDVKNPFALKGDGAAEVEQLVFQQLSEPALDEPFSKYPGLAQRFTLAPDALSLLVELRPEATFSDGTSVTADDVVFSFELFHSPRVLPFYKSYWADVLRAEKTGALSVRFVFARVNPELAAVITELPVLPQHVYAKTSRDEAEGASAFASQAVGSGPYVVKALKPHESLLLERREHWWGEKLGVYRGRFNFAQVEVKYFREQLSVVEALKKGDIDLYQVQSAKAWALDLSGDKFAPRRYIRKEELLNANAQGGLGFFFNLRDPLFADLRVRQAISLAFDFDWTNKTLFYGQYREVASYFQNTPLAASGLPSAAELAILKPLAPLLPAAVFTDAVGSLGRGLALKERLRLALSLLGEAGYHFDSGVMVGPAGKLAFRFLLSPGNLARVVEPFLQNLRKIGVVGTMEEQEPWAVSQRLDQRQFQLTSLNISESLSPGNEQRDYWGSKAALEPGSLNYSGLRSPAVDQLVQGLIYAKDRPEQELYSHCLDRVLYHSHLRVPNWYTPVHRVSFWDKFSYPATRPLYYGVKQWLTLAWYDPVKAARLQAAVAAGVSLP